MLELSEKAIEKIKEFQEKENKQEHSLRVVTMNGGCCGPKFDLLFDENVKKTDVKIQFNGLQVVFEKETETFVQELQIDFIDSLEGHGFVIKNPATQKTCACD